VRGCVREDDVAGSTVQHAVLIRVGYMVLGKQSRGGATDAPQALGSRRSDTSVVWHEAGRGVHTCRYRGLQYRSNGTGLPSSTSLRPGSSGRLEIPPLRRPRQHLRNARSPLASEAATTDIRTCKSRPFEDACAMLAQLLGFNKHVGRRKIAIVWCSQRGAEDHRTVARLSNASVCETEQLTVSLLIRTLFAHVKRDSELYKAVLDRSSASSD
jgi:hypothetical protein